MFYRFHRTLRGLIARYQLKHNTETYIDILPDILKSYNNSYHTTINMAPSQATSENEHIVYENVYRRKKNSKALKMKPFRYKIGDNVRMVSKKTPWSREFFQRWSEEIFTVSRRYRGNNGVALYKVTDCTTEEIRGSFYTEELSKVTTDPKDTYRINKILDEVKIGGKKYLKVNWVSYPEKCTDYVLKSSVQQT